jgi:hypothetical protein
MIATIWKLVEENLFSVYSSYEQKKEYSQGSLMILKKAAEISRHSKQFGSYPSGIVNRG